jgi:hypothetical protein
VLTKCPFEQGAGLRGLIFTLHIVVDLLSGEGQGRSMARPVRIRVADGWYHVMGRGRDRGRLFGDDAERQRFLELLAAMRERFCLRVYAYALMDTHHHLSGVSTEGNWS